jgi:thiol:disulfide interchange protein DsbD
LVLPWRLALVLFASLLLAFFPGCDWTGQRSVRVPESAHGIGALDGKNPRVEARLLIDAKSAKPGEPVRAGVLFDLDRGWHIYWRDPGQVGLPTELHWEVEGANIGSIAWPIPEVFRDSGKLISYGYEDEVLITVPLTFEHGSSGQRTVSVSARFAACRVRCIPGRLTLSRTLLVTEEVEASDDETHAIFQHHAARVPSTEEPLAP